MSYVNKITITVNIPACLHIINMFKCILRVLFLSISSQWKFQFYSIHLRQCELSVGERWRGWSGGRRWEDDEGQEEEELWVSGGLWYNQLSRASRRLWTDLCLIGTLQHSLVQKTEQAQAHYDIDLVSVLKETWECKHLCRLY